MVTSSSRQMFNRCFFFCGLVLLFVGLIVFPVIGNDGVPVWRLMHSGSDAPGLFYEGKSPLYGRAIGPDYINEALGVQFRVSPEIGMSVSSPPGPIVAFSGKDLGFEGTFQVFYFQKETDLKGFLSMFPVRRADTFQKHHVRYLRHPAYRTVLRTRDPEHGTRYESATYFVNKMWGYRFVFYIPFAQYAELKPVADAVVASFRFDTADELSEARGWLRTKQSVKPTE